MSKMPSISDAEWEVMKIIWKHGEITANEIIKEMSSNIDWKPNTIKTLINRLLNKEVIAFNKFKKEYSYYAVINEEECIKAESRSFLDKVFNGSINSMLLNFVKSQELTKEDIQDLKDILNNSEEQR